MAARDPRPGATHYVNVHFYATAADEHEAARIAALVEPQLRALGEVRRFPPERYWKMPDQFGVVFQLRGDDLDGIYEAVQKIGPAGWTRYETFAVWNDWQAPGEPFVTREITWVCVQIWPDAIA
jgi:hypothetical protein